MWIQRILKKRDFRRVITGEFRTSARSTGAKCARTHGWPENAERKQAVLKNMPGPVSVQDAIPYCGTATTSLRGPAKGAGIRGSLQ